MASVAGATNVISGLFGLVVASFWVVGGLWLHSTWQKRQTSLHVRVRMPTRVFLDISIEIMVITIIGLQHILSGLERPMPCFLVNATSALGIVLSKGVILRRVVML
jgi:hypothetical protein